jgi:high-affinity Fe2+/Pb2+ permease
MKTALKISGLLLGFFLFLSITIKDKPIFTYFYDLISPATKYAQSATEGFFSRSLSSTQTYSKKLFDNSVPKLKDSVDSKQSASLKRSAEPLETVTHEEKAELDELIKNHQ